MLNRCMECKHLQSYQFSDDWGNAMETYVCDSPVDGSRIAEVIPQTIAVINDPPCISFENKVESEPKIDQDPLQDWSTD